MQMIHRAALGLALLLAAAAAHALTATELVAKNIEAKGGAAAVSSWLPSRRCSR